MSQSNEHNRGPNENFNFEWGSDMETSLEDLNIGDLGQSFKIAYPGIPKWIFLAHLKNENKN